MSVTRLLTSRRLEKSLGFRISTAQRPRGLRQSLSRTLMERSPNTYSPTTTDQAIDEVTLDRRPGHPAVDRNSTSKPGANGRGEPADRAGEESEPSPVWANFPRGSALSL